MKKKNCIKFKLNTTIHYFVLVHTRYLFRFKIRRFVYEDLYIHVDRISLAFFGILISVSLCVFVFGKWFRLCMSHESKYLYLFFSTAVKKKTRAKKIEFAWISNQFSIRIGWLESNWIRVYKFFSKSFFSLLLRFVLSLNICLSSKFSDFFLLYLLVCCETI